MDEYTVIKKCCLICGHAVTEDIDDIDYLILCHCRENLSSRGGSPRMKQNDVCKCFVLNNILTEHKPYNNVQK